MSKTVLSTRFDSSTRKTPVSIKFRSRVVEPTSPHIDLLPHDVYTWSEISQIHKTRNGIYQRNGRLISLLTDFGRINPCYPDVHGDKLRRTIFYTGSGRRGDQKLDAANRALLNAIKSKLSVPLFNKLAVGRWEFTGYWR